jgi:hypothetical protein
LLPIYKFPKYIYWQSRQITVNNLRTTLAKREIFVFVSPRRWRKAQAAEVDHWNLQIVENEQLPPVFISEQIKARFLLETAERILGIRVSKLIEDKVVVDIACGPCSVVAEEESPFKKIGVDPAPFPEWVKSRYKKLNFPLISSPMETALIHVTAEKKIVVVMYNALQHFQSPSQALKNIRVSLKEGEIFFVDYADIPADKAHPQILTFNRIKRLLKKKGYSEIQLAQSLVRLPGYVEGGSGSRVAILAGYAKF